MATFEGRDDRQHGHAIRRRQGGRTSVYHEQLYPAAARQKAQLSMSDYVKQPETFETYDSGDLVRAIETGEPGALEEHARRAKYTADWANASRSIRGSDSATGAY
jgi:hypothetical protein